VALYIWAGIILAVLGFVFWIYREAKSAGTDALARDVAENTADVAARQADAQANAPRSKDAVVDRLREKGL
jgi:hypothetical protein